MTCADGMVELMECARQGVEPGRQLGWHLAGCEKCAERWESERQLTEQFRSMRLRAAALMAHDTQRDVLMRDFAGMHRPAPVRRWVFALGMAAAVLAAVLVGHIAGTHSRPVPATRGHVTSDSQTVFYEASADAGALSADDFIAVPYTPPLAQGELIRVVHTDLHPEALARMGIDVDPAWASEIPADVVVGEDGIPRAVRITENAQ